MIRARISGQLVIWSPSAVPCDIGGPQVPIPDTLRRIDATSNASGFPSAPTIGPAGATGTAGLCANALQGRAAAIHTAATNRRLLLREELMLWSTQDGRRLFNKYLYLLG